MRSPSRLPSAGVAMLEAIINGHRPRVLVQGATGRAARRHIGLMRGYGTDIVAGVSRTHSAGDVDGIPVFAGCAEAVAATGAEASVTMVPPMSVLPAIEEAAAAGLRLIVTVTEGMPVHDAMRARDIARSAGMDWVGASTPGIAIPGRLKMGFLPDVSLAPGPVAVMSRSGTLSYEINFRLVARGLGQSAWIGVGGDPVKGLRFAEVLPYARPPRCQRGRARGRRDRRHRGGGARADAMRAQAFSKPVYAVLAGDAAPEGKTMGHAGALIHGTRGTLASKTAALTGAGAEVFTRIDDAVNAIAARFGGGN